MMYSCGKIAENLLLDGSVLELLDWHLAVGLGLQVQWSSDHYLIVLMNALQGIGDCVVWQSGALVVVES